MVYLGEFIRSSRAGRSARLKEKVVGYTRSVYQLSRLLYITTPLRLSQGLMPICRPRKWVS
jgi:hypothetical protein